VSVRLPESSYTSLTTSGLLAASLHYFERARPVSETGPRVVASDLPKLHGESHPLAARFHRNTASIMVPTFSI